MHRFAWLDLQTDPAPALLDQRIIARVTRSTAVIGASVSSIPDLVQAAAAPLAVYAGGLGDALFASSPRSWTKEAWAALSTACDALEPSLAGSGRRLLIRPHHRHVLGDTPSALKFFAEREGGPFGLLLEPAALVAPSMLAPRVLADHLARIFEVLAPRCDALLLTNITSADPDRTADDEALEPDAARPAPLDRGAIDPALLAGLALRHTPPATPIVLASEPAGERPDGPSNAGSCIRQLRLMAEASATLGVT